MKNIRKIVPISILIAAMGVILIPFSVAGDSEDATALLRYLGASFIVHDNGESLSVITYDWKTPSETCKTLTSAGIVVDRVVNYGTSGEKPYKDCLIKN